MPVVYLNKNKDNLPSFLKITLSDGHLKLVGSPNEMVCLGIEFQSIPSDLSETADLNFKDIWSQLGSEGTHTLEDGSPAIQYTSDSMDVLVSKGTLKRLLCHALTPPEFLYLYAQFPKAYELHDDFYDPVTGEAFQPNGEFAD